MKKIIFLFIAILTLVSCEDFLTVDSSTQKTPEDYYTSEEAIRKNTAALYCYPWFEFYGQLMVYAGDQLAGNVYYTYADAGHFYYNKVGAGNSFSKSGWEGLYRVINWSNTLITDMPVVAKANGVAQSAIDQAVAEARFMRGTAYIFLAELWGDVPIIENATALMTSGVPKDIYVNRHTQSSIYRFICEDLEYAVSVLQPVDPDNAPGRVTQWGAKGMLARAYLQRAAYEGNDEYYTRVKELTFDVIENSGLYLLSSYAALFDVNNNNNRESLFAFQCRVGGYGYGNPRNAFWARSSRLGPQAWGGGLGPSISLQEIFTDANDTRRKATFMLADDIYPELGGYKYQITYREPDKLATVVENSNFVLSNFKKYIIGNPDVNGGMVGLDQDGANNLYVLRLADVYLMYVEACIGLNNATDDATAKGYFNYVRHRAGITSDFNTDITFADVLLERRKEFAFEGINWFDVKRFYYRDHQAALDYLNGMQRDRIWAMDYNGPDDTTEDDDYNKQSDAVKYEWENNKSNYYLSWETVVDPDNRAKDGSDRIENILFSDASMKLTLPASVTSVAPILLEPAVDFYNQ
ncbi:MAG: RagB/SusD family nutrient uptake outer membrane protein [Candidatus Symbiothrix sp.]|nr:RagB/SusD family nutrient uptake outer membrane protein [Candidatus Symbiothrix sp.]